MEHMLIFPPSVSPIQTDTLNPFENNNGQFFTTATTTTTPTVSSTEANNGEMMDATSVVDSKQQENTLIKESGVVALALLEDQRQELADLRRQVVYLQVFARSIPCLFSYSTSLGFRLTL